MLSADSSRVHRSRSRDHPGGGLLLGLAEGSRIRTFRPFLDQCLSVLVEPCAETICAPERSFSVAGPIVRVRLLPPLNLSLSGVGEEPSVRSQPEEKQGRTMPSQ